ncbi:MAG: YdiU family protein [Verrucomicrobiota bacterium]
MASSDSFTPSIGWNFDNSYRLLPADAFSPALPQKVPSPELVIFNSSLSEEMGLHFEKTTSEKIALLFSGNEIPDGAEPIAQAYAGHQFGGFNMLGDGRAILLGEHVAPNGTRWDIQLKGAGRTPYSRRGDGKAALGPMLREYLISEAMQALGIPTTRSLAVVRTGETIARSALLPGAILTRVAQSHIRVGTFELFAAREDREALQKLTDYTIARHYPHLRERSNPYPQFLKEVIVRQAELMAQWMLVGFIHGVMNTDNMAISGETIDYGPCAFMDRYDPATVFSSIDHQGRYAYGNQARMAFWNLSRFAETLVPFLSEKMEAGIAIAEEQLRHFSPAFENRWIKGMRAKLGIVNEEKEDLDLFQELLRFMHEQRLDYTESFRFLSRPETQNHSIFQKSDFPLWKKKWIARLDRQTSSQNDSWERMRLHNPVVIPRNHLVENALQEASEKKGLSAFHRLLEAITHPYEERWEGGEFSRPSSEDQSEYQTFCGT